MDPVSFEESDEAQDEDVRSGSLRAIAGLFAVVTGLVAVFWLLSLTDDSGPESQQDSRDSLRPERESIPTTLQPSGASDGTSETGTGGDEDSDASFSGIDGRLAYLSREGVVIVDLRTGELDRLPVKILSTVPPIDDMMLMSDSGRTIGMSGLKDSTEALVIASNSRVVPASAPLVDYWVVSQPFGPNGATRLSAWQSYGFMWSGLTAPTGSELVTAKELGLLVVHPSGGTFLPTVYGFKSFSEHRVLAAGSDVRVEQRCDEQLACEIVLVKTDSDLIRRLPEEFVAELADLSFSPDDRWLLNNTSPAWLLDRAGNTLHLLETGGYERLGWSEDSRLLAWLTKDRTPALIVVGLPPAESQVGAADTTSFTPSDAREALAGLDDSSVTSWAGTFRQAGDDEELAWQVVDLSGLGADPTPDSSFLLEVDSVSELSLSQR